MDNGQSGDAIREPMILRVDRRHAVGDGGGMTTTVVQVLRQGL
jgi:hypothetical protein